MASLLTVSDRVRTVAGNDQCADCNSKNPHWATVNNGGVICTNCSGVHRLLGVEYSFVQSLIMDNWTEEHAEQLLTVGNEKMNAKLEYSVIGLKKPVEHSSRAVREAYIRAKYVAKDFMEQDGRESHEPEWDDTATEDSHSGPTSPKDHVGMVEYIGFLVIKVIKAEHLKIGDIFSSDPYIKIKCGGQTVHTKTIMGSLNPIYNETLMICATGTDPVVFEVWDYDRLTAHDYLGEGHVTIKELEEVIKGGEVPLHKDLKLSTKGVLHVEISFNVIEH